MVPVTTKQKSDDSWLISGMESSMVMTRHDQKGLEIGIFQGGTAPWAMGLRTILDGKVIGPVPSSTDLWKPTDELER